jgi:hypothetical protein
MQGKQTNKKLKSKSDDDSNVLDLTKLNAGKAI